MARRKSTHLEQADEPTFEEALARLDAIVEAMENQQVPLEDLVAHYEQGSKLLLHCEGVLNSARDRIELITLRNQSENALESHSPHHQATDRSTNPNDLLTAPADPEDDDDIRLL